MWGEWKTVVSATHTILDKIKSELDPIIYISLYKYNKKRGGDKLNWW